MPGLGGGGGVPRPQVRGWFKRRLPLITPVPGGHGGTGTGTTHHAGGNRPLQAGIYTGAGSLDIRATVVVTHTLPGPVVLAVRPPHVIRSDYSRGASVFWERTPPPNPVVLTIRPPFIVRSDYERGAMVYTSRPPLTSLGGLSHQILLPLVVRSDHEQGANVYLVRPPLKPPPVAISGGILPALVVRSDYTRPGLVVLERFPPPKPVVLAVHPPLVIRSDWSRGASVFWDRPPSPAPRVNVAGFAVLLEPLVVRSDYTRDGLAFWVRPPFLPPPPSIPGFAVLLQPRIVIGPRPPDGVGVLEGIIRFSVFPPTPTGIVGPRLQFYRGPEAGRPNLLIGEPAWTIDAHGMWVGDGTYDHFIGGDFIAVPAHSNSTGYTGQKAWDGTYLYLCIAVNTWIKITPFSTSW